MNLQNKSFKSIEELTEAYSDVFKLDQIKDKELKITLCGNYGATNIGDDAILLTITKLLQEIHKYKYNDKKLILTILTYDPSNTSKLLKTHGISSDNHFEIEVKYLLPFGIRSFLRGIFKGELFKTFHNIRKSNLFILGGGGLFSDEESNLAPVLWVWQMFFAKKVLMFGQSIQIHKKFGEGIVKWAFKKAKIIHVRDQNTLKFLNRLGIEKDIFIDKDIVFRFPLLFQKELKEHFEYGESLNKKIEQNQWKGYVLLSIRKSNKNMDKLCIKFIQQALSYSKENGLFPIFIPFQSYKQKDIDFLNKIIDQSGSEVKIPKLIKNVQKSDTNKILVHDSCENLFQLLSIFKFSKKIFGQRLHSLVFGLIMNISIQTIPYSKKVESLLEDLNI
jgi:polysaccharide pyruvyl transferase WcaK-like protein